MNKLIIDHSTGKPIDTFPRINTKRVKPCPTPTKDSGLDWNLIGLALCIAIVLTALWGLK
jgi:hypothetical protein